jgi:hypothetical protein
MFGRIVIGGGGHFLAAVAEDDLGKSRQAAVALSRLTSGKVGDQPGTSAITFSASALSSVTSQTGEL